MPARYPDLPPNLRTTFPDADFIRPDMVDHAEEINAIAEHLDDTIADLGSDLAERFVIPDAVGDGVANDSAAIQTAATAAAGKILLIPGNQTYNLGTTEISIPAGTTVLAHGATFKSQRSSGAAFRFATPTLGTERPLTATATEGAKTVTVSTGHSADFAAGDHVNIIDDTNVDTGATYQTERNVVLSVDGGTGVITLLHPLNFSYTSTSSATTIFKIADSAPSSWQGGHFDLTGATLDTDCITATYVKDVTVRDVTAENWPAKVVQFNSGYNCLAERISGEDPSDITPARGYVVQIAWCRNSTVRDTHGTRVRHTVDVTAGSDCWVDGVYAVGRTSSNNVGTSMHGLRSKRMRFTNIFADNVEQGFTAGNGTFQGDHDWSLEGYEFNGCDLGVFVVEDCDNWYVGSGNIVNSVLRALIAQCNGSGVIDGPVINGITSNPSNYGAFELAGTGTKRVRYVKIKGAIYHSIRLTGDGDFVLDAADIDHTAVANGIQGTGLNSGAKIRISNQVKVVMNVATGTLSAVAIDAPSGVAVRVGPTVLNLSTLTRGVTLSGGHSDAIVAHAHIDGAAECVRFDNTDNPTLYNNYLKGAATNSNCIRFATGTINKARIGRNIYALGNAWANTASTKVDAEINVVDFGADPTGVNSSTAAFRAARDAHMAAGRGVITGPQGWYYLGGTAEGTFGGVSWLITIYSDNMEWNFPRGTTIATRKADGTGGVDLTPFAIMAPAKIAGIGSISSNFLGDAASGTYYTLNAAAKGATEIDCATAANAGNIAAGDWLYIRTGQMADVDIPSGIVGLLEPDAEINQAVAAGDAGTGLVKLRWPLSSAYEQEYFISGTAGKTSTSVTANPATFGVRKVTNMVVQNPRFVGFKLDTLSSTRNAIEGRGPIVNPYFDIEWECGGSPVGTIEHRGLRAPRWPVKMIAASAGNTRFLIPFDVGCTDGEIRDVDATAIGRMLRCEFHEAAKNCRLLGGKLYTEGGNAPTVDTPLSITSRAEDFYIRDFSIISLGSASPVFVSSQVTEGGTLENVKASCTDASKGIAIEGTKVRIVRPDPNTVIERRGQPYGGTGSVGRIPQVPIYPEALVCVLDTINFTDVPMGVLPANAFITKAYVDVRTAFVSAGATTQRITVGYSGVPTNYLLASSTVDAAVAGAKRMNHEHSAQGAAGNQAFSGTKRDVICNYTTDGGAPSAGAALVIVEYYRVPKVA